MVPNVNYVSIEEFGELDWSKCVGVSDEYSN